MNIPYSLCVQFPAFSRDGNNNKISCIRAIRALTSLGLKEAKDLVESTNPVNVVIRITPYGEEHARDIFTKNYNELERNGVKLQCIESQRLEKIRSLVIEFINANEFDMASTLLNAMKEYWRG